MNHHHRKTLHALFAHPVSGNLSMREVEGVFRELGAEVETGGGGKLHVTLAGKSRSFSRAGHDLPKDEVIQIRKFLIDCGIDPATQYPL